MLTGEKVLFGLCNTDFVSQLRSSRLLRLSLFLYRDKDNVAGRDKFQSINAALSDTTIIFVLIDLKTLTSNKLSLREFFEL